MNLRQPLLKLGSHIRNSRRFSDQVSLPGAVSSPPSVSVADPSYPMYTGGQTNSIAASSFQNPRAQLDAQDAQDTQDVNRPVASQSSPPPAPAQPESLSDGPNEPGLNLPSPIIRPTEPPPIHVNPFHTHVFFTALEKTFPSPVARTLMAATRGLLVDRILRIRRASLIAKDLDNQAYLFRAALSELRTESAMHARNQTASMMSATAALRRGVDHLDGKMKEDIAGLKHHIQLEMDDHRNETRAELSKADVRLEDIGHRATLSMGDLRTEMEQAKWDNTRRAIAVVGGFVLLTVVAMELRPTRTGAKYPPPTAEAAVETIDVGQPSMT